MAGATSAEAEVAVIGGGVVGCAVAHALARRGVAVVVLEAEGRVATAASGTNSGILHTGFDSKPGELETELILRSAALRASGSVALSIRECGATVRPVDEGQARTVATLAERAKANGVEAVLRADGSLEVPGEAVTDPVAYTFMLAGAVAAHGGEVRTGARVEAISVRSGRLVLGLAGGDRMACVAAVNCAGLFADDVARLAGDDSFAIYPRKGEFFVFDPPDGAPLQRILLPVPTARTKGVLVFPSVDGKVIAGPTAHDQEDKTDWSVRPEARGEVMDKAREMHPPLEGAEPIASYAGLRPAGRGVNYLIGPSRACAQLINVAAIRSTGLSASLGIGERAAELVAGQGIALGPERPWPGVALAWDGPWWWYAARDRASTV